MKTTFEIIITQAVEKHMVVTFFIFFHKEIYSKSSMWHISSAFLNRLKIICFENIYQKCSECTERQQSIINNVTPERKRLHNNTMPIWKHTNIHTPKYTLFTLFLKVHNVPYNEMLRRQFIHYDFSDFKIQDLNWGNFDSHIYFAKWASKNL